MGENGRNESYKIQKNFLLNLSKSNFRNRLIKQKVNCW